VSRSLFASEPRGAKKGGNQKKAAVRDDVVEKSRFVHIRMPALHVGSQHYEEDPSLSYGI
jgi:hypothetical protein